MIPVETWWAEMDGRSRHWLLFGKGPSFDTRDQYDLTPYTTIAINHVVRELKVDVASAVNPEVIADCGEDIYRNSRYLLMPRRPHILPNGAPYLLEHYVEQFPVLKKLDEENRLVWYNLSTDPKEPGSGVVEDGPFSVCILFNLLGVMKARQVRTLGVDGGTNYGFTFADIEERTRLQSNIDSYDYQWWHMMRAVKKYGFKYRPLNDSDKQLLWRTRWLLFRHYVRANPKRAIRRWLEEWRAKRAQT